MVRFLPVCLAALGLGACQPALAQTHCEGPHALCAAFADLAPRDAGLRLVTLAHRDDLMRARLDRADAGGGWTTGPVLELSVLDARLTAPDYAAFAAELLRLGASAR